MPAFVHSGFLFISFSKYLCCTARLFNYSSWSVDTLVYAATRIFCATCVLFFWFWFCRYLSDRLSHSSTSSQPITGLYFLEIALRMDLNSSSVMWPSSRRFINNKTNNRYFVSDWACFWFIFYLLSVVSIYHSKRLGSQVIWQRKRLRGGWKSENIVKG